MTKLQSQEFTVSGTFVVPANVSSVMISGTAGGGGGGPGYVTSYSGGSGGGAGEQCSLKWLKVTPGDSIAVTIGNGGSSDTAGTATTFGSLFSLQGGFAGSNEAHAKFKQAGGGGWGGADIGIQPNAQLAVPGRAESGSCWGGSGGGGVADSIVQITTLNGYGCAAYAGGSQGAPIFDGGGNVESIGGAGGGASFYGVGGSGGDGTTSNVRHPGNNASGFGAGGGGVGGGNGNQGPPPIGPGGSGMTGYLLIQWCG